MEKLLSAPLVEKQEIEHRVEQLWTALEEAQVVLDNLAEGYLQRKDYSSQKAILKESNDLEKECTRVIEKAQATIIAVISATNVARINEAEQNDKPVITSVEQITGSPANPALLIQNEDVSDGQSDSINAGTVQSPQTQSINNADLMTSVPTLNEQTTTSNPVTPEQPAAYGLGGTQGADGINHRLKQLKVPTFDGDKTKFEE